MVSIPTGCGLKRGTLPFEEPAPTGTVVGQGELVGLNEASASGIAQIYRTSQSGQSGQSTFVLRLAGVTLPDELPLQATVTAGSASIAPVSILHSIGTHNYTLTVSGTAPSAWDYVTFFSFSRGLNVAQALLRQ